ncbi:TetR/AcrR family transcriptional regulator C-terminal domain-containing protein [Streptomyces sp. ID03-2B]|uniref:TetR/AcrR family transcriptional regulator n=1 Tax=Streptomyces TaxID=1883 RepID=UPI0004CC80C1|nr:MULTISPECIES: TetR/AcrR family transcriptional regulator C-terminal domain-containing protein [Streptomyces]MCX4711281.1 TetR/AcrR family transcriptional regulator [Streptomyces griseus]MDX3595121.1 TetR/AcrR family transcriptional regulator C-terminal domain-containing protein [Streptomyces sp. ID03-2B]QXQ99087.1 TetR/AcrR family transcriptional regulator [Streptomyces sp. WY228]
MVVFAGQGDARRSLSLLWRAEVAAPTRGGPGPKPRLSVDAIVTAAVAVADEEGMAALSMRAVGDRLGRTAMALYTHVPGKSELLDLMYDAVHAELPSDYEEYERQGGWRVPLTAWAGEVLEFYVRHPWVLQVSQARPVLGPHEYANLDTLVRLLGATGLEARTVRRLVGTLFPLVQGSARTVADARRAAAATGSSDEEWWAARSAALTELVPDFAERFPAVTGLERDGAPEPPPEDGGQDAVPYPEREARETFRVGLDVLLDGIEAARARRP